MFRKSLMAIAIASLTAGTAWAAVSADEAKQLGTTLTPTWFQVFPGMDMLAPVTWSQGISGNAAVQSGGDNGAGSWSAGLALDIYSKYRAQLTYTGYYGNYTTNATGAMAVNNGVNAALSDRGWVSLTLKATF